MNAAAKLELHSLASLRAEIRRIHTLAESDVKAHAQLYITRCADIGRLLSLAKQQCKYGQWSGWAAANLPFDVRQAQKYLKVYRQRDKLLNDAAKANSAIRISVDSLTGAKETRLGTMRFSGDPEYYTPPEVIEAARELFGGVIDLDPASCKVANSVVKARRCYTKEQDGLTKQWRGNVWLNPPYKVGQIPLFVEKLSNEIAAKRVTEALILLPTWSETVAYVRAVNESSAYLFFEKRLNFWKADGTTGRAPNGQTLFYYGRRKARFKKLFKQFGPICTRL